MTWNITEIVLKAFFFKCFKGVFLKRSLSVLKAFFKCLKAVVKAFF